jgi:hypothetical protein
MRNYFILNIEINTAMINYIQIRNFINNYLDIMLLNQL